MPYNGLVKTTPPLMSHQLCDNQQLQQLQQHSMINTVSQGVINTLADMFYEKRPAFHLIFIFLFFLNWGKSNNNFIYASRTLLNVNIQPYVFCAIFIYILVSMYSSCACTSNICIYECHVPSSPLPCNLPPSFTCCYIC